MPQRKKVPFSTKQKKQQLVQKRQRKTRRYDDSTSEEDDEEAADQPAGHEGKEKASCKAKTKSRLKKPTVDSDNSDEEVEKSENPKVNRLNQQPTQTSSNYDPNRFRLHFQKESKKELQRRREYSTHPIEHVSEEALEIDPEVVFLPGSELDMPKRPPWNYSMSKEALDARENKYFREYLMNIERNFSLDDLSYFELNMETWRQLWRVLEMSDILLIILDIRFPSLLFSPALYDHITKDLKKDVMLVLNKIDLAPPPLVLAWKHYFLERFPKVHTVYFTSFPGAEPMELNAKVVKKKVRRCRLRMATEAVKKLVEVCDTITSGQVDLSSWKAKIEEELLEIGGDGEYYDDDGEEDDSPETVETIQHVDTSYHEHVRYKNGILTIGTLGQPNVGKSSLINAIKGKKVVSVSRTPGHTKHFQTIFLTPTVKLCDCPGLVFPSKVPRALQILAGSFPIAQVREPYTAIRYLAERINLPQLLNIRHPELGQLNCPWSAFDICDAWAEKRGFLTGKAGRNDVHRAANNILRMAVEGRICLCLRPPGFSKNPDMWVNNPELEEVIKVITRKKRLDEIAKEAEEEAAEGNVSSSEEISESSDVEDDAKGAIKGSKNKFSLLDIE